jgi:hypothetical protein
LPSVKLIQILKSQVLKPPAKTERIIVSVCSGRSEVEMQSSDLCLCLDKCKKSIYAGAFGYKYLHALILSISKGIKLPVLVLFQHPSPTKDKRARDVLASASADYLKGLLDKSIEGVYYVYNSHTSTFKNSWKYNELKELILSKCSRTVHLPLVVGPPSAVSQLDEKSVLHPIVGLIDRSGWAKMKKGVETSFQVHLHK